MPAYKYQLKTGKTKWYANFYYEDWTGTKQHKCKRGFDTKKEANEYERLFLDKFSKSPTILFSSLVDNYLDDMKTRLKPTTIKNKEYLIRTKLVPYFGKLQICNIDAEVIRKWQNVLIEYRDCLLYTSPSSVPCRSCTAVSLWRPCRKMRNLSREDTSFQI